MSTNDHQRMPQKFANHDEKKYMRNIEKQNATKNWVAVEIEIIMVWSFIWNTRSEIFQP